MATTAEVKTRCGGHVSTTSFRLAAVLGKGGHAGAAASGCDSNGESKTKEAALPTLVGSVM